MKVQELILLLERMPQHVEVLAEISFNDGDDIELGAITGVSKEYRCGDRLTCFIRADADAESDEVGEDDEDDGKPRPVLRLVKKS